MATPAGPISTAPAAPAPSVAPASAPSSAPAAPVSQPASGGGTAGLETGATTAQPPAGGAGAAPAAAPAAATPQGPPKNTDFPNSTEGQLAFLAADKRWQAEHPEGAAAPASQAAAVPPAGQPDAIPAEAQPAAEQPKPGEAAPVEPPTPQALDELLTKTPELKAVLDKPEMKAAKDAIFESARRAAELEPIAAIVPTVADAEFMQEHTAALVGLKTASMRAANDPALIPQVLDQLDQQFAIVDKDGKPVLGPDGKPQFAADRAPFIDGIVNREMNVARTKITGDVAALKAKLASGVYPNEAAKARDQAKLDNLEFAEIALKAAEQIRSGEFFQDAVPQIPQDASPEFRSWAEAETKRIADERKALEDQRTGANRDANKATATQFATNVRLDFGATCMEHIASALKAVTESGVYIPEFYLQDKYVDPGTGKRTQVPEIAARIFRNLETELMKPGSRTLMEIVQHELLPPTEQTRTLRKEWYQRQVAAKIPGLVRAEVKHIQDLVKLDQAKLAGGAAVRAQAAQQEPNTGTSNGLPQAASDEQITKMAWENAKKHPIYAGLSLSGQQALFLTEYHKLRK